MGQCRLRDDGLNHEEYSLGQQQENETVTVYAIIKRRRDLHMVTKKSVNKSIFVSSTFRDMQVERDALRDYVLPRVNEFAAQYGRAVEIIDLRWGVDTSSVTEAEQNHKVLRTCLDEIERSRPFFLGLIGDRYGWTPPHQDMEAALDAARFSLDGLDKSVTELEIEYGVLRAENPPVCFFYFRESPDYSGMSKEQRGIYQDDAINTEKLEELKRAIRTYCGDDVKTYTVEVCEDELVLARDWSEMVAADIIAKLQEEWGEPEQLHEQAGLLENLERLAVSYGKMGTHLATLGKEEAGAYYSKSRYAYGQIYEQTDTTEARENLSLACANMGIHLTSVGKTGEADESYRRFFELCIQGYQETCATGQIEELSMIFETLGDHFSSLGKVKEAEQYYQTGLEAAEHIYGQTGTTEALEDLSISYGRMGVYLKSLGRAEDASVYYQEFVDAREEIYRQTGTIEELGNLSACYRRMGEHLGSLGKIEEADVYYQKSNEAREQVNAETGTAET